MTDADVAEFLQALMATFPEVRLFHRANRKQHPFVEVSLGEAMARCQEGQYIRSIFAPDWEPEYGPSEYAPNDTILVNTPPLSMALDRGDIRTVTPKGMRKTIRVSMEGSLTLTNDKSDPEGKRIVDKVLRLHRKLVARDVHVIDLRTGERVDADHHCEWYGRDMARKCRQEDDLYLKIAVHPGSEKRWGLKPAAF